MKDSDSAAEGCLVLLCLLLMFPFALWAGHVMNVLWCWFAAGLAPAPGAARCAGLMLMARLATHQVRREEAEHGHMESALVHGLLYPLVALGTGWVLKAAL